MKCPYCHIKYETKNGFEAHKLSCFYKENPLPKPKNNKRNKLDEHQDEG